MYKNIVIFLCLFIALDVYGMADTIKEVVVPATMLDKKGNLTVNGVKTLLVQACKDGKWKQDFPHENAINIKGMEAEQREAPWGTVQLFWVESSGSKGTERKFFVLKEMKEPLGDEGEIAKLIKGSAHESLEDLIYPASIENLPQFIFPIAYIAYKDATKKDHYLSLMPAATGKPVTTYIKMFAQNPQDGNVARLVSQSYFDIGAIMATFYKKYKEENTKQGSLGKSIVQGDFHAGNIFYDRKSRQIVLIDNERLANSINGGAVVCQDVAHLLIKSLFIAKWVEMIKNTFPYKDWFELSVSSFILGFLSTYSKDEVLSILKEIDTCLKTYGFTDKKSSKIRDWYTDKETLGTTPKTYLDPIMQKLNRWFEKGRLIASDVNIDLQDDKGKTLLFIAAQEEPMLIWPLIAAGAGVNVMDKGENAPLHDAALHNKPNAIKALIDAGAEVNAKNKDGLSPLDEALKNDSKDAIAMLKQYGAQQRAKEKD